jgi:hypothetical protein
VAVAEEGSTLAAEESAPLPQAETVAPATKATLPEAGIVEGEYTVCRRSLPRRVDIAPSKIIPYVFC